MANEPFRASFSLVSLLRIDWATVMSLRRVDCPGCAKKILVSGVAVAVTQCPGCGRGLEVGADGVRLLAPQSEKPLVAPVQRPRSAPQPQSSIDVSPSAPPPIPTRESVAALLSKHVVAVAAGVAAAVVGLIALVVVLWIGAGSVRRPMAAGEPDIAFGRGTATADQGLAGVGGATPGRRPRSVAARSIPAKPPVKPETPTARPDATTPADTDPVQAALDSVALVRCGTGHGSGFMAAPNLLVTNHHVIAAARVADLRVRFPDHRELGMKEFPAELVLEDPRADLAVLAVNCGVPALSVQDSYRHVNGQRVVAIGSPGTGAGDALQNLTTDGRLGPPYRLPNGNERWALAMAINPGNSGGPVLDAASGQVVAVVVAKFTKTESQSLAVPHDMLVNVLGAARRSSPRERQQAESLHRQRYCLINMVRMFALADRSFRKSCDAAIESDDGSPAGRLTAFNDFKSMASRVLSDEFTVFETVVCSEVDQIAADADCDAAVRAGITKLRKMLEGQAEALRRSVPLHEIDGFLREFRTSLARSRSLAATVAKSLGIEETVTDAEGEE